MQKIRFFTFIWIHCFSTPGVSSVSACGSRFLANARIKIYWCVSPTAPVLPRHTCHWSGVLSQVHMKVLEGVSVATRDLTPDNSGRQQCVSQFCCRSVLGRLQVNARVGNLRARPATGDTVPAATAGGQRPICSNTAFAGLRQVSWHAAAARVRGA